MQNIYSWANKDIDPLLVRRFNLSMVPQIPNPMLVLRTIQPVTQADELFKKLYCEITTPAAGALPTGTGRITIDTVPTGKRRTYYALYITAHTGSTNRFDGIWIREPTQTVEIEYETFTASANYTYRFNPLMTLEEAWEMRINISTYNAGDKEKCVALYIDEDSYQG